MHQKVALNSQTKLLPSTFCEWEPPWTTWGLWDLKKKEVYKINHHFYCMWLTVCWVNSWQIPSKVAQLQMFTKDCIRRWHCTSKQDYFHQHFVSENHHGLTDPSDPTRREFFWMPKLKTLAPLGLNVVKVYKIFLSCHCEAQRRFYSVAT